MVMNNITQSPAYDKTPYNKETKPIFPKTLNTEDMPRDTANISGRKIETSSFDETDKESPLSWRDVVSSALLVSGVVTGTLTGTPGAIGANIMFSPPEIERTIEDPGAAKTKQPAPPSLHIISHMDASENIIEPFATSEVQQLENIKAAHSDNVEIDALLVRNTGNPYKKIAIGGTEGVITLAPGIAGWAISRKKKAASALLIMGIGGALTYGLAKTGLGFEAIRNVASGVADLTSGEPVWNGTKVYHIEPDSSKAIDSKLISSSDALKPDVQTATDFIASQMKEYPKSTTVVHMIGHGLSYHSSSGFDFKEYQKVLKDASEKAGRKIDLLVVESCLEGNVEALIGTMPSARYVIISEESIAAGILPDLMNRSIGDLTMKSELESLIPDLKKTTNSDEMIDARKLGEVMIRKGKNKSTLSTLALVDMEKVPALSKSIDEFGKMLLEEVKAGRTAGIAEAIKNTPVYPQGSVTGDMGEKLGMGDLKAFTDNIIKIYGGETESKVSVNQESASSPQSQALINSARNVQGRFSEAVIASTTNAKYKSSNGLSIQLPISGLEKLESKIKSNKMTTFAESQAPQGWKDFVGSMSAKMIQPQK